MRVEPRATPAAPLASASDRPKHPGVADNENEIMMTSGAWPAASLSDRRLGAPGSGSGFDDAALAVHRSIIDAFGGRRLFQELLLALRSIATRHGVSIAGVAFRAMHDHEDGAAVLAKRVGPSGPVFGPQCELEARQRRLNEKNRSVARRS
jgi:hypothetical protein